MRYQIKKTSKVRHSRTENDRMKVGQLFVYSLHENVFLRFNHALDGGATVCCQFMLFLFTISPTFHEALRVSIIAHVIVQAFVYARYQKRISEEKGKC